MKLCAIHLHLILTIYQLKALNISRLTQIYNGVCGGNSDCVLIGDNRDFLFKNGTYCHRCSCNSNCVIRGDCCPNVFFQLQPSCIDIRLLTFNRRQYSTMSVLMIDKCPQDADNTTIQRCESVQTMEEKLSYPPVTSTRSNLTYRNIYCAICFNESEAYLSSWRLHLLCEELADFNFASSYKEIADLANARRCNIDYHPIHVCSRTCTTEEYNIITKCNISGTWKTFDPDIEFACRTYDNQFRFFKNVFCYICNPPRPDVTLISRCNVTGLWNVFDEELENSCLNSIYSNVTLGFKNVYCYLCNRKNATLVDEFKYTVEKEECMSETHEFLFTYKINHFSNQLLQKRLEQILSNILNPNKYKELNPFRKSKPRNKLKIQSENISNVTNLFKNYFVYQGTVDICLNNSGTCDCSERCYFSNKRCCFDKLFDKSTACTDRNLTVNGESYLVYNSCKNKSDTMFYKHCKEDITADLFSILPVEKMTHNDIIHYTNIHCALCNEDTIPSTNELENENIFFWEIHISCTVYIPFIFHASFDEYLDFTRNHGCQIRFKPPNEGQYCDTSYEKCNETGNWMDYIRDIDYACNNLNIPTKWYDVGNPFCAICNPPNQDETLFATSNVKTAKSTVTPKMCLKIPIDRGTKNIVCELYYKNCARSFFRTSGYEIRSFQLIFSISSYKTETRSQQISKLCNESQVYYPLKNECRDILCHPGRFLARNECIPLIPTTYNLGYAWSFDLKSVTKKNVNNTAAFIRAVEKNIRSFVQEYLQVKSLNFESSYLFTNLNCMVSAHWINGSDIIIKLYQKIFITEIVNRTLIESKLSNLYNNTFNVFYDHSVYEFIIYNDNSAFHLSQNISILKFPKLCLRTSFNNETPEANKYVHSHVSRLLFCKQIELTENEFIVDAKSLKLCRTSDICETEIKEYNLIEFKRARICLKDFETFSLARIHENSKSQQILGIIMLICTFISLLCLFMTFIAYCVFPSLRTLPGKNNMCLVLAMFIAHSLFQFGIIANHTVIGCKIIGILIHYFWLSTFGCLNVCSLHMYRVFESKTRWSSNNSQNRIFKKYMLYAFGTPAVIISVNITINFITSKSVGYGGHICFLNEPIAVAVTFITPVTLVCTSNIYFFIVTSLKIASSQSEEQYSSINRVQFAVYIKLFTITGITWIFQILDSFLPMSEFSTAVSLMNSLQGVFIFTAYICNKRVLYLWKQFSKKNDATRPKNKSHLSLKTLTTSCVLHSR